MIRIIPGGVEIVIRVIPRARKSALAGVRDDAVLIRLAAPPVDGAANAADRTTRFGYFIYPAAMVLWLLVAQAGRTLAERPAPELLVSR